MMKGKEGSENVFTALFGYETRLSPLVIEWAEAFLDVCLDGVWNVVGLGNLSRECSDERKERLAPPFQANPDVAPWTPILSHLSASRSIWSSDGSSTPSFFLPCSNTEFIILSATSAESSAGLRSHFKTASSPLLFT